MAALPLRLLLVEDQPLDAELILANLEQSGFKPEATCVETRVSFLEQLSQNSFDAVLCDYNLPSFGAIEALHLLREHHPDVPFIIISGSIGEETAVEAIKRGADDYLLKDRLGRLASAVALAVEQKKLRANARRAEEDLRQSEYKYRCLFEHLLDAAYLCDANSGRIIDTNLRGESLLGKERASILGLKLNHFVPAPTLERLFAAGRTVAEGTTIHLESGITASGEQMIKVQLNATLVIVYGRRLLFLLIREMSGNAAS